MRRKLSDNCIWVLLTVTVLLAAIMYASADSTSRLAMAAEGTATPSPKADTATPSPKADNTTPSPKADNTTPSPKADNTTPSSKADNVTPSPKADTTTPSPKGENLTPSPSETVTETPTPVGTVTPTATLTPTPMVIREEMTAYVNASPHARVRVDAGTDKAQLRDKDGYAVELTTGTIVRILHDYDKVVGKGDNALLWYKIQFTFRGQKMEGYTSSTNLIEYDDTYRDEEFEAELDRQGFPESYRPLLRAVHMWNPTWIFVAQHTGLQWSDAVDSQYNKFTTANVDQNSPSSWKSTEPDKEGNPRYNWAIEDENGNLVDGGWIKHDYKYEPASRAMIEYTMDPRNFLAERTLFMFQLQTYMPDVQTIDGVASILKGTDMSGNIPNDPDVPNNSYQGDKISHAQAFMLAAEQSGVSPYALAIRSVHEVNRSKIISGTFTSAQFPTKLQGLYNYYNFNAYKTSKYSVIEYGLLFAANEVGKDKIEDLRPWKTRVRAIVGGAIRLGATYINVGQNTSYLQKYNVSKTNTYRHQYMSNVTALYEQASSYYNRILMQSPEALEAADVFQIPVYLNMPEQPCARPVGDGNPNAYLKSIEVEGQDDLTPEFSWDQLEYDLVVEEPVESVTINVAPIYSKTKVTKTRTVKLAHGDNIITIESKAENGNIVRYILNICREGEGDDPTPSVTPSVSPSVTPSVSPSVTPGVTPSVTPVDKPTEKPTEEPTEKPTEKPSDKPTEKPTPAQETVTSKTFRVTDTRIDNVAPETDVAKFLADVTVSSGTKSVRNAKGETVKEGFVGTGFVLVTAEKEYTIIVYGDTNCDGKVSSVDLLYVKRHVLKIKELTGSALIAADVKKDSEISARDMLYVKRHILGIASLSQAP